MDKKEKAVLLFSLIGDHLPKEVLEQFSREELEKLMKGMNSLKKRNLSEERKVLSDLQTKVSKGELTVKVKNNLFTRERSSNEESYSNSPQKGSPLSELKKKKKEDLELIVKDEQPRTIALVMSFADPDEVSTLIEDFPEKVREQIIDEIQKIDFYSEKVRSELDSFLSFKYDLIESRMIVSKVKNRSSKTVAEILSRISPNISFKLFSSLKERNPEFAETINEHFYTIQDLLYVGRTSLSNFLSQFHPIVLACAFKGIETDLKDKILERSEPWVAKQIQLEMDSMGPVSLAEIEESQKALIEGLNNAVDSGKIKLWKVK
jgi:flagellar motor switch protein FliG